MRLREGLVVGWIIVALIMSQGVLAAPKTRSTLCNCDAVPLLSLRSPPLKGPDVAELQERLIRLRFYRGPIDGIYGPTLTQGVKKMQATLGVSVNGKMDKRTWEALALYEARPAGALLSPPTGEISILVDIDAQTLVVYSDNVPYKLYPVAIGKPESPTPAGEWVITEKTAGWQGATGVRWMRLSNPWGSYGIHGTNNPTSIGQMASAGCVRMFNHDVTELYEWVNVGTTVVLKRDGTVGPMRACFRTGAVGQDVVYLQWRLRQLGFNPGRADGVFGGETARTVAAWQKYRGLKVTGVVDENLLFLLGLL